MTRLNKQQLLQLTNEYYDLAVKEDNQLTDNEKLAMTKIEQVLSEYFDEYKVDGIGDLQDKLLGR